MADDERDPRSPGSADDDATPRPADTPDATAPIDETREYSPVSDTVAQPPGPDDTVAQPPGPDDTVRPAGGGDVTRPLPPPTSWTARAEVPSPRPAGPATMQWEQPPDSDGGRWWMPIVIGIVALLLLGVLGYGLWLIAAADDDPGTTPTPAPTTPITTRPPTTAPPSPSPEPAAPVVVEVPDLSGEPLDVATAALDDLGLRYRVRFEATDEEAPGTVLRTEPEAGREVEEDSRVTIYVAAPPEPAEPPTGTESPPGDDG